MTRRMGAWQIGLALLATGAVASLAFRRKPARLPAPAKTPAPQARNVATTTGRELNGAAAILALSVLADSGVEHYRGSFANRAMYVPLVTAASALGASVLGARDRQPHRHRLRDLVYALSACVGFVGLGFHAYNIGKRPGGFSWLNLFYAAPVGAPMALALAGFLGRCAEKVRDAPSGTRPELLGQPAGRTVAAVASAGLAGTVGEAALLHFRGAYHNPAMLIPVTVPPIAAASLGAAALTRGRKVRSSARWWLELTAAVGFAGAAFHAYGVSRNMGGWRNWTQNLLNGPPLPAPPSFTGLALAGLAALNLLEEEDDG